MSRVGLDLSLTSSGVYFGPNDFACLKGGKLRGIDRLVKLRQDLGELFEGRGIEHAIIEEYAYHATSRAHRIGEWGGVARTVLADVGVKLVHEVPPTSLKKWATGHGHASKAAMIQAAVKRSNHLFPNDDVADAALLWWCGEDSQFLEDKGTRYDVDRG